MINRGDILIADLLEAFVGLNAGDDDVRAAIASLLGLNLEPRTRTQPLEDLGEPAPTPAAEQGSDAVAEEPAASEAELVSAVLRFVRQESSDRSTAAPAPNAPRLDAPTAGRPRPRAPESLLFPRWARGVISAALSTRDEGRLDVDAAVEILARAEPLARVPALPRPTLRNGAQVLLDRSDAMLPFYPDQPILVRQLADVVGAHRLEVLRFKGCPSRGAGTGSAGTWSGYHPPREGTPVLLVTDLGIGRPPVGGDVSEAGEWREFVSDACAAGCPTVAFVPYPAERLPPGLPRQLKIVRWERSTTARDARHAVGGLLEARRR